MGLDNGRHSDSRTKLTEGRPRNATTPGPQRGDPRKPHWTRCGPPGSTSNRRTPCSKRCRSGANNPKTSHGPFYRMGKTKYPLNPYLELGAGRFDSCGMPRGSRGEAFSESRWPVQANGTLCSLDPPHVYIPSSIRQSGKKPYQRPAADLTVVASAGIAKRAYGSGGYASPSTVERCLPPSMGRGAALLLKYPPS